MNRARGAFDECWFPMFIDRLDGKAGECDSCSKWMLQAMIWIKESRTDPTIIRTPGTLSLSSYLTCIFLTVTCTLLIILAVKEAQRPCDWGEASVNPDLTDEELFISSWEVTHPMKPLPVHPCAATRHSRGALA